MHTIHEDLITRAVPRSLNDLSRGQNNGPLQAISSMWPI